MTWTDKLDATKDAHSFLKLLSAMAAEMAYVKDATVSQRLKRAAREMADQLQQEVEYDAE